MKRIIKKRKLKLQVKIFLMCISLTFLFLITFYFTIKSSYSTVTDTINYNEKGSLTYSVCLNQNDYISGECFSDDRGFVTSLIDMVNVNLKYNIMSSNPAKYEYSYTIKANLIANEKNNEEKVVYDETTTLDNGKATIENSFLSLDKKINLDYQYYNNIITSFKKNYILSLDSKLKIIVEIKIEGKYDKIKDTYKENHKMEFDIPIADQTALIEKQTTDIKKTKTLYKESTITDKYGKIISKVLYVLDFIVIIWFIVLFIKLFPKQKTYTKKIKKILKEYDRAIVKAKKKPDLENLNIIEIDTFEELLDAKDNLNKPILFSECFNRDSADFIILNNNEAYIYTLSAYEEQDEKDNS